MPRRPASLRAKLAFAATVAAGLIGALAACAAAEEHRREAPLALFTTLPIYWVEAATVGDLLQSKEQPHWARTAIERQRDLRPVDVLTSESLAPYRDLLAAQPRALAPAENVALDEWVRNGGHLLLFADPLLTAHSNFAIGDARRPQDTVLISPILAHWGLRLEFDPDQPAGEHAAELLDRPYPVDMAGRLVLLEGSADAAGSCKLLAQGLAASCRLGKGKAVIVADAALLDPQYDGASMRENALTGLLRQAFARD